MKKTLRAGLLAATVAASGTVLLSASAGASGTSPALWQNSSPDPHKRGTLTFYAAGSETPVTSGSITDPLPAFAVGGAALRAGDTAAALWAYTPDEQDGAAPAGTDVTQVPGAWSGAQLTATTPFPAPGAPAAATDLPVATVDAGSITLARYIAGQPNNATTSGYAGVYEIRLRTVAPGKGADDDYDSVFLGVSGTTWTVLDPSSVATAPDAPAAPTATPSSSAGTTTGQVGLSWTAPADNGSGITGYSVRYGPSGANAWTTVGVAGTSTTITGLTKAAAYDFEVAATNAGGTSGWSPATTATVPASAPAAVAKPALTPSASAAVTTGQLVVTWVAPQNGGSAITGYTVAYAKHGTTTYATRSVTAGPLTITGLAKNTAYDVKVSARNAIGSGAYSPLATALVPATVPFKVATPAVVVSAVQNVATGKAVVKWTAPHNGGSAITGYVLQYKKHSVAAYTSKALGNVLTYTLTGLAKNTSYDVRVYARNAKGSGAVSAAATKLVPATLPGRITTFSVVAGTRAFTATWARPGDPGGIPVSAYVLQYRPSTSSSYLTKVVSAATLKVVVGKLITGRTYYVRVAVRNAKGTGSYSVLRSVKAK